MTLSLYVLLIPQFESSVHADFELEYLLLEGHCFDATTSQPPRGLQFTLGTEKQPALVDTIVMANLVREGLVKHICLACGSSVVYLYKVPMRNKC